MLFAVLGLAPVLSGWGAEVQPQVPQSALRACASIVADAERLACYDRELAAHTVAPEKTFGLSGEKTRETQHIKTAVEAPSVGAKVAVIAHRPHDGRDASGKAPAQRREAPPRDPAWTRARRPFPRSSVAGP